MANVHGATSNRKETKMANYKMASKFVIEIEEQFTGQDGNKLYRVKGFNSLVFDEEGLKSILEALSKTEDNEYGIILRAKGYVPSTEGSDWLHFDLTPGEYEIRKGSADYTGRLCVIGSELKEDKISGLFGV